MLQEEIGKIQSTRSALRQFGFTIGGVLIFVALWLLVKTKGINYYLLAGGSGLVLVALLAPKILTPFQKIWMILAVILGWVMTRIILGILFYLILTPTALWAKLWRKQFLLLKPDKMVTSYWKYRDRAGDTGNDLRAQF
jgi:hypothetical protein